MALTATFCEGDLCDFCDSRSPLIDWNSTQTRQTTLGTYHPYKLDQHRYMDSTYVHELKCLPYMVHLII